MRGYDRAELYGRLIEILGRGEGMTGSAISKALGISRITVSKYLDAFASEGLIRSEAVGNSRVWRPVVSAGAFEFPADYARASAMFAEAVSELSGERASSVVRSCVGSGARAVLLLSEVLAPAIDLVKKTYDGGKIGSAEMALMHNIISSSIANIDRAAGVPGRGSIVAIAADPHSALLAEGAAAALAAGGRAAVSLGDMSFAAGVMLDTELEKLLVRVRAPRGEATAVVVFAGTPAALRTLGTAADAARRGAARGTLLALCGPEGHGIEADASVATAADAVHWVESL